MGMPTLRFFPCFLTATLLILGLPFAAQARHPKIKVGQTIVLDGTGVDFSGTYFVAETTHGFEMNAARPNAACEGILHVPREGIVSLTSGKGVFTTTFSIYNPLLNPPGSAILPDGLNSLENDCDVLESFTAVDEYIHSQAISQAREIKRQVELCAEEVRGLWCQLVSIVENTGNSGDSSSAHSPISLGDGAAIENAGSDYGFGGVTCFTCYEALLDVGLGLNGLEDKYGGCLQNRNQLAAFIHQVQTEIDAHGGALSVNQKKPFLLKADQDMASAEQSLTESETIMNQIVSLSDHCTLETVKNSCAQCTPENRSFTFQLNGSVLFESDAKAISKLAKAFEKAARQADPNLSTKFRMIASRLNAIPDGRVLHVIFKTDSPLSQRFVALPPPDAPDDGQSPLALILTALDRDARLPERGTADQFLLFDVLRKFAESIKPSR